LPMLVMYIAYLFPVALLFLVLAIDWLQERRPEAIGASALAEAPVRSLASTVRPR
jgi:hypothetical protein